MIQLLIEVDSDLYKSLQRQAERDNMDVEQFVEKHLEYYYGQNKRRH